MPKLKKAEIDERLHTLGGHLRAEQARRWDGKIPTDLIAALQISESTYFKRKREPGSMRVDELLRLSNKLKIPVSVLIGERQEA